MPDRTGIARGSLKAVIYFESKTGKVILPPEEIGSDISYARMAYEKKYRAEGWQWREASTLHEVDELQKRITEQCAREYETMACLNDRQREAVYRQTGEALRGRMVASDTTPWERDFIRAYLDLRESKRNEYREALTHHNMYIFAREQDSNKKIEDMLPVFPGQVEVKP